MLDIFSKVQGFLVMVLAALVGAWNTCVAFVRSIGGRVSSGLQVVKRWFLFTVFYNLYGWGWWIYFKSRYIQNWSRFYRWLYERPYQQGIVMSPRNFGDLADFVRNDLIWVPDGPKELWDVFKSPKYVQWVGWFGDHRAGDCGAFAVWLVAALNKGVETGKFEVGTGWNYEARILSIGWLYPSGYPQGHNVCLIRRWSNDPIPVYQFAYQDYGDPSPWRSNIIEVLHDIEAAYFPGGVRVAWSVSDGATLTPIEVHVG